MSLSIERRGLEPVPASERRGRPRDQFTLWFAANLGFPAWALGLIAVGLGMNLRDAVIAIVVGNLVGAALVALPAALGPETGLPQLPLSRVAFGHRGTYVPAGLNVLATLGWFTVNTILGAQALAQLLGGDLPLALLLLTAVQVTLAMWGHDLIHRVERYAAVVLLVLFLVMTRVLAPGLGPSELKTAAGGLGPFLLATAIIASYLFSWAPYAADYSRYLPASVGRARPGWYAFAGSFIATTWVEVLGALTAVRAPGLSPIVALAHVMGPLKPYALVAVVLGTITANVLNVYTGATSALTLDLRTSRARMALIFGLAGLVLAFLGARGFDSDYENFLLLISYWVAPWIAIMLAEFYGSHGREDGARPAVIRPFGRRALLAFGLGVASAVPFMNQGLYEGPVARLLGGGDVGYYVAFIVAYAVYRLARPRAEAPAAALSAPPGSPAP